jgi:anti-sigma B factor antagonist
VHRITVSRDTRAVVVTAAGELDAYVAPELGAALERAGGEPLIADFSAVSFLDSTALGLLVRAVRDRGERGGETRVVLPLGTARRIFELTTLDSMLPVSASVDGALAEIGEQGR